MEIHPFRPHTWASFLQEVKPHIRCDVTWKKLSPMEVSLDAVHKRMDIRVPNMFGSRGYMNEEPPRLLVGIEPVLIRCPAVEVMSEKGWPKYLLLDGVHKWRNLSPAFILLDIMKPEDGEYQYFLDLHHPFWRGFIGGNGGSSDNAVSLTTGPP